MSAKITENSVWDTFVSFCKQSAETVVHNNDYGMFDVRACIPCRQHNADKYNNKIHTHTQIITTLGQQLQLQLQLQLVQIEIHFWDRTWDTITYEYRWGATTLLLQAIHLHLAVAVAVTRFSAVAASAATKKIITIYKKKTKTKKNKTKAYTEPLANYNCCNKNP